MKTLILETPRLLLREMRLRDLDAMSEVFGDEQAQRFYPAMAERAEVRRWIEHWRASYERHGLGLWAMELRDDRRLAGDCGLIWQEVEGERLLEVGYHVHPELRRRGLATEAARACRDLGFAMRDVPRIVSLVHVDNEPSARVAERVHSWRRPRPVDFRGKPHWVYGSERP